MKIRIFLLLLIIILSGCTSEFDRDIEQGKTSLKSNDYEGAVKHLENALIEKPTNKDAQLLLVKAQEKLEEIKLVKLFTEYHNDSKDVVKRFIETKDPGYSKENDGVAEYTQQHDDMELIYTDAKDIAMHYQNNSVITKMHSILLSAIDNSLTMSQYLIPLTEMIEDKNNYKEDDIKSYGRLVKSHSQRSNEDTFKYVNEIQNFRVGHKLIPEDAK